MARDADVGCQVVVDVVVAVDPELDTLLVAATRAAPLESLSALEAVVAHVVVLAIPVASSVDDNVI